MTEDEKIIRKEAEEFYEWKIQNSGNAQPIDDFKDLRYRLQDFYTPENKAVFLDEIQLRITDNLKRHRDNAHGGKASPTCSYENTAEKLLFYIRQEIDTFPKIAHQKHESKEGKSRTKVFISYSHLDKEYLKDIQRHFKPFLSHIDFWDDTKIQPGQKWKEEIKNAINETKVAILLVSTDFLGSEEEGAVILIVILKPCLFEEFPELNQYQAMNPPSKSVLKMDYDEKEELYVNLVRQTKRILNS